MTNPKTPKWMEALGGAHYLYASGEVRYWQSNGAIRHDWYIDNNCNCLLGTEVSPKFEKIIKPTSIATPREVEG